MAKLRLSTLIDRYYDQQETVKAKKLAVKRAEAEEKKEQIKLDKIGDQILDRFKTEKVQAITGQRGHGELKTVTAFNIADWGKLTSYVYRNKAAELFQRRLNKSAVLEHRELRSNRPVPGVKQYSKITLSVTKAKGK